MNRQEEKRIELQKRLDEVEAMKSDLQMKLCHFENCAKRALKATSKKFGKIIHFYFIYTSGPTIFRGAAAIA